MTTKNLTPVAAITDHASQTLDSHVRMVFLDFDGVLHPTSKVVALNGTIPPAPAQYARDNGLFCFIDLLAGLLKQYPDVMLMVHSSWRHWVANAEIRELLGELAEFYVGCTEPGLGRYASIQSTVERSGSTAVVILDDNPQEFPTGCAELMLCDPELGISDPATLEKLAAWMSAPSA